MSPLTNLKNLDSLKCGMFSAKPQGIRPHKGPSEWEEATNKGVDLHGEAGILADCLSAQDRQAIADTDMCASCAERMAMSKRIAQ